MKNINIYILLLLIVAGLTSCEKERIPVYDSSDFINLEVENEDEFIHSFSLHPGQTETEIPMVVELIGNVSNIDRIINYSIVDEETTASTENFDLPENFVFKANKFVDTVYLKIKNTEILKTEEKTLAIKLEDSKDFSVKIPTNSIFRIKMHDKLARPNWWNSTVESEYLGDYSDEKFILFMQVTGVSDFTSMDEAHRRSYSLKFKYYLKKRKDEGNPALESDFSEMEVTVIG